MSDRSFEVFLLANRDAQQALGAAELHLQARAGASLYEFVLKRAPDAHHVTATVVVDGETRSVRIVPLPSPDIEELLREELSIVGSDRVFEDALGALVALA